MVCTVRIDNNTRARVYYLRNVRRLSVRKTAELCNVSKSSVWRISRETRQRSKRALGRASQRGRPRKLTEKEARLLLRCVARLRHEEGNFNASNVMDRAGISKHDVSVRTVTRLLNENGYFYLVARKKGILTAADVKNRLSYAKYCKKHRPKNYWTDQVSFYLDATSFAHKTNPFEQACAPKGRTWRKKSEGLLRGCTSKGRKEGTGGRLVRVVVAISYGKGVIACEPYERMCGAYFADFIDRNFNRMFEDANKEGERIFKTATHHKTQP